MPVYNNRFYPEIQNLTWQNLADQTLTWADGTVNWNSWTTPNVSTNTWTYTDNVAIDLGSIRTFYPTSTCTFDIDGNATCLIGYSISNDNITYTNVAAGVLTARYVKTQITTNSSWIERISTDIHFDTRTETFSNVNTASLTGTVDGRILPVATIGNVYYVSATISANQTITSSAYEIRTTGLSLGGTSIYVVADYVVSDYVEEMALANGLTFVVRDLDTWGKANTDAVLDFVVSGYPTIVANANLGIVYAQ